LEPIAWFPGSYEVKIFQLATFSKKIHHLKPFLCIYAPTGEGQSISASPEKFAKQLCSDFSLTIERVLWVEDLLTPGNRYQVVMFTKSGKIGETIFYRTEKRLASRREIAMIRRELSRLPEVAG